MLHCTEYIICARQISEIIAFLEVVGQTPTIEFETELICGVQIYPNSYHPNFTLLDSELNLAFSGSH
jgi:hypothetical protein